MSGALELAAELGRVLTFRAGYNTAVVVAGTTLLGVAAGVVGTFALLRRRVLVSDALAHATLPGLCGAFVMGVWLGIDARALPLLLGGATVSGLAGVVCVHWLARAGRLTEDAALAVVLSVFFGAGAVALSAIQRMEAGGQAGLGRFILGQTAALGVADVAMMGVVAAGVVVVAAALFKELRLVCFDRAFGAAQGWPITGLDLLLLGLIALVTVVGLQAVGLILVVALIVAPATAARFWTDRLGPMAVVGGAIGGLSGYLGASVSALLPGLPAGAIIVLAASAFFLLSMLAAPRRGVLAEGARRLRLRARMQREHLLRALYEYLEARTPAGIPAGEGAWLRPAPLSALAHGGVSGAGALARRARGLGKAGLLQVDPGADGTRSVRFTERGLAEARRLARVHRLWEAYLVGEGGHRPDHAHDPADLIEHVLEPEIIAALEQAVAAGGRAGARGGA